jgi:hypothetical protein
MIDEKFTCDKIRKMFLEAYNDNMHFMTPNAIRYGKAGRYLYELSEGRGIYSDRMYGVTFLNLDGSKTTGLNSHFSSQIKAERFIKNLRNEK